MKSKKKKECAFYVHYLKKKKEKSKLGHMCKKQTNCKLSGFV